MMPTVRQRSVLVALPLAILASCSAPDAVPGALEGRWTARVDTIADTITVHTIGGSEWGTARLVEELRIGTSDGADHEVFGSVWAIEALPDGDILVYDDQAVALRRYASDGSYRGLVGRKGSGPGEYKGIPGLALLPDGRFVVHDFGNRRFNVYGADGAIRATWLRHAFIAEWRPLYPHPGGGVFLHDRLLQGGELTREEGLVRLDGDGAPGDTIVLPHSDFEAPGINVKYDGGSTGSLVPFSADRHWSVTRAGELVMAIGDRYAVDIHRADGRVLRLARAGAPVAVSEAERNAEIDRITRRIRRRVPGWNWDGTPVPGTKPPISWLHVARDGRIWVRVAQAGRALPDSARLISLRSFVVEPIRFDVFEPDGRFLGQVEAPSGLRLEPYPVLDRDHIWAVIADEDGVQRVARFRIERE